MFYNKKWRKYYTPSYCPLNSSLLLLMSFRFPYAAIGRFGNKWFPANKHLNSSPLIKNCIDFLSMVLYMYGKTELS